MSLARCTGHTVDAVMGHVLHFLLHRNPTPYTLVVWVWQQQSIARYHSISSTLPAHMLQPCLPEEVFLQNLKHHAAEDVQREMCYAASDCS